MINENTVYEWKLIYDDINEVEYYETSCGKAEEFTNGDIEDNHYNFCPYCGKRIKEIKNYGYPAR